MATASKYSPKSFAEKVKIARYNTRLKEIGLLPMDGTPEYHIWNYEEATNGRVARYSICRSEVGRCPVCGAPYAIDAVAEEKEVELTHYRQYTDRMGKVQFEPVALILTRNRWKCLSCYDKIKKYNARWDNNTSLVEGHDRITIACKKLIAEQSLRMEQKALADIFGISEDKVKSLMMSEIQRLDALRYWDNIGVLGLYSITLGTKDKTTYCLCTDVEKETFVEFFSWADDKASKAFLKCLVKKTDIKQVLTSIDATAVDFAKSNFPDAEILVDQVDVKERLLDALHCIRHDEILRLPEPIRKQLQVFWPSLDKDERLLPGGKDMLNVRRVKSHAPNIGLAYDLKESGYEIYRQSTGQAQLVEDWVNADKHGFQAFETLENQMRAEKQPVIDFAVQNYGADRSLYEASLKKVREPVWNYLQLEFSDAAKRSAKGSRAVSAATMRGKILYGAAAYYNQEQKMTQKASHSLSDAIGVMDKMSVIYDATRTVRQKATPQNFGIPLSFLPMALERLTTYRFALMDMDVPLASDDDNTPSNIEPIYFDDDRKETPPMEGSFNALLDTLREASNSKSEQGTMLERLIKQFLLVSPLYSRIYDKVWLWTEFPYNGNQHDMGIDLVAHLRGEEQDYCAIQVKFYDENYAIQKSDVDTFLSASGKPFYIDGTPVYYKQRLIVSTTDKWSSTAENTILGQRPPVNRIRLQDLQEAGIDWDSFTLSSMDSMKAAPKKQPRPHQKAAIQSVLSGFETCDRGKLIMACGTGKTITGLKIAEAMTQGQGAVLVLVPSISLLNQTLAEWATQCEHQYSIYGICSDPKASKITEDEIVDAVVPATTDVETLCYQYAGSEKGNLQLFFSTYQSINVVHDFQQKSGLQFDLIICDEAHRTTGVTLAGEDDSNFVRVHDNEYINAKKRLYMTATPRIYADASKQKAKDNSALLCSMDDETIYGPEFYRLSFSDAVSQGLLSDYKVIVLAVDEDFVNRSLQKQLTDINKELSLDDAVKIVGCMNGLAKKTHFPSEEDYFANDPQPMRRAVAFTQTISQSKKFVNLFKEIQALYKINTSDGNTQTVELQHVDGSFNALERKNRIEWLKHDAGEDCCRVLSNARCLSEGVDVPALDAVMFLNPRKSIVDIIQSVGRVMRKSEGKKYGYIILPIGIPAGMEPEEALADNQKYKIVWDVLQALRAHDDRFNNTINRIELNKRKPENIAIIGVSGPEPGEGGTLPKGYEGTQLAFDMDELQKWKDNIYAKIVKKCGSRQYWETWAKDIADIAARHIAEIKLLLEKPEIAAQFDLFLNGLRANLNPSIDQDDAIEMLAEHLITKPVFDALFENYSFLQSNPVSQIMQKMLDILHDNALEKEQETLSKFYASVQERAKGIDNAAGKQKIIVELYEQFFKNALPKETERLGIVYTPVEVVDFIIQSVEYIMRQRFGHSISDMGVHVLDPFTGTGTFIVQLLRSGIIKPEDLLYKYTREIHCNEIVLLAYYIAAVNIEETYHELSGSQDYVPFEGIVLTDTFELAERVGTREGEADTSIFQPNADRATKQMQTPIQVIIGNPPYSVGQKSGNDNNQNVSYPNLDEAIQNSYVKESNSKMNLATHDSYIKAFRWASDRIKDNGVIGFVTNGTFLTGGSMDGFRKCLLTEFNSVYCFNLRGNQRTSGELSRKEGGKIFGSGSRTPVAITILVKKKGAKHDNYVNYYDIGDYLSRADKLRIIDEFGSIEKIRWEYITPDTNNDWLNLRNPNFVSFIAVGDKKKRESISYFADRYAAGVKTNRDAWIYNFSAEVHNAEKMIDNYNAELTRCVGLLQTAGRVANTPKARETYFTNARILDSNKISWSRGLLNTFCKGEYLEKDGNYQVAMHRPFCKEHFYFSTKVVEWPSQWTKIFPSAAYENRVICMSATSLKGFSVLMTDCIQDYDLLQHAQCFPMYVYEKVESAEVAQLSFESMTVGESTTWTRKNAITDAILKKFRELYGDKVTKEDIFYYLYAVLQSPQYNELYKENLTKEMPRVPMLAHFPEYVKIGRALADLHLNYEKPVSADDVGVSVEMRAENYTIEDKMRFGKVRDSAKGKLVDDKSVIIYNPHITIRNIPVAAYDYIINGKSAIEWIVEQYAVTTDKASGIVNDPNTYAGGKYIFDLLLSIISVSLKTQELIAQLPEYKEI